MDQCRWIRISAVSGGIDALPADFTRASDVGTSAWMVPHGGDLTRLPININPRTGKKNAAYDPQSHGSWLEANAKWLAKNYDLHVDDVAETGWSAIQKGWIRKTGEPNALNYTISASDIQNGIRSITNDIWATVVHYQQKGTDLRRIGVHVDVWVDPGHIEPIGEFNLGDFMSSDGDVDQFLSPHRVRRTPRQGAHLASIFDDLGRPDLADRIDGTAGNTYDGENIVPMQV